MKIRCHFVFAILCELLNFVFFNMVNCSHQMTIGLTVIFCYIQFDLYLTCVIYVVSNLIFLFNSTIPE